MEVFDMDQSKQLIILDFVNKLDDKLKNIESIKNKKLPEWYPAWALANVNIDLSM